MQNRIELALTKKESKQSEAEEKNKKFDKACSDDDVEKRIIFRLTDKINIFLAKHKNHYSEEKLTYIYPDDLSGRLTTLQRLVGQYPSENSARHVDKMSLKDFIENKNNISISAVYILYHKFLDLKIKNKIAPIKKELLTVINVATQSLYMVLVLLVNNESTYDYSQKCNLLCKMTNEKPVVDSIEEIKKKMIEGIDMYLETCRGFFASFFHNSTVEANKLKEVIKEVSSLCDLKKELRFFLQEYHGNVRNSSLKTRVLESIFGELTRTQRCELINKFMQGKFDTLEIANQFLKKTK